MYSTTITTPLSNGVTQDKLVKILHRGETMVPVLAPDRVRFELKTDVDDSSSSSRSSSRSQNDEKAKLQAAAASSYRYEVTEPGVLRPRTYGVEITRREDGCETAMRPPYFLGGASVRSVWKVVEEDVLVERVEIWGGWWPRRQARKRFRDHEKQQRLLMQLAATSKSMNGSYSEESASRYHSG